MLIGAHRSRCSRKDPARAVVYDFTQARAGEHARAFLGNWRGSLVCDDYLRYKASFAPGLTEAGCMAHARRKVVELQRANQGTIAGTAIGFIGLAPAVHRPLAAFKSPPATALSVVLFAMLRDARLRTRPSILTGSAKCPKPFKTPERDRSQA